MLNHLSPCNYILAVEPTLMRAQKYPIYLGIHTYRILKGVCIVSYLDLCTAVYCSLFGYYFNV